MGLYASKPNPSFTVSHKKSHVCDDGQSKATVTTEDSSVMHWSPSLGYISHPQKTPSHTSIHNRQTWRSGSQSAPNFANVSSRSQNPDNMVVSSQVPKLLRRDSDPGSLHERRPSVPVKCPPRRRKTTATTNYMASEHATSPADGEDSHYLMRMYDTRTWEMYRRITEARKNSQYSHARNNNTNSKLDHTTARETTSEWENLQHDYPDSGTGHEMVFLFDFD